MVGSLLDGKLVASELRNKIHAQVHARLKTGARPPGLAVILIGEDSASSIYVNNKRKACKNVGFKSFAYDLPNDTSERALLVLINKLNLDNEIDGILVQLPLPEHINTTLVLEKIKASKDVDGFHPYNLGRLAQGNPALRPCTPYGIIQLLKYYQLPLKGKHAVIVGASNIVGRPMAMEFLYAKSTVTICHSATSDLQQHVKMADILIVATGIIDIINTDWLNSKQVVVDVGIHRLKDGSIRGDIDFNEAKHTVQWITPVPGGVGPMTICTLLENTLRAAEEKIP